MFSENGLLIFLFFLRRARVIFVCNKVLIPMEENQSKWFIMTTNNYWSTIKRYITHDNSLRKFNRTYTEKISALRNRFCLTKKILLSQQNIFVICAKKLFCWASKIFLLGLFVSLTKLFYGCKKNVLLV